MAAMELETLGIAISGSEAAKEKEEQARVAREKAIGLQGTPRQRVTHPMQLT
jgi:hypothetical protein